MRRSILRWAIGASLAVLAAGCAVGDTVELRMNRGRDTRPHEPGVEIMVLTTPIGGAIDTHLLNVKGLDSDARHRAIGDLFAMQGDIAGVGLGPDQRRFVYVPTIQGPDVVPIYVSMRDDKPRVLWVVASYATKAEGPSVHMERREDHHRHVHHLHIGRNSIKFENRPGTDS